MGETMGGGLETKLSRELPKLREKLHEVFDGSLEKARAEAREVSRILNIENRKTRHTKSVEFAFGGSEKTIQITWAGPYEEEGMSLCLYPISEGVGPESGVFAYKGRYGLAKRNKAGEFQLGDNLKTLEDLYEASNEVEIFVIPTATRWAGGKESDMVALFGENARVMYMGLGFLMLKGNGHNFMLVGGHEVEHINGISDENEAWHKAIEKYARLYKGKKTAIKDIVMGKNRGRFDLLKKPVDEEDLTIGEIISFGLVSHDQAGDAKAPKQWMKKSRKILDRFWRVVQDAQEKFDEMTYR